MPSRRRAFAVGREARLRLAENIIDNNDRANFLEAELSLQQLRGPDYRSDPKSGGRALAALARLEEKKGSVESMKLAAAYYRELNRDFGNVAVRAEPSGSRTGAELFNELATDPRFRPYLEEPGVPWGNVPIGVREIPGGASGGLQIIFQPEGDPTPLMKQLGLANVGLTLNPASQPVVPLELETDVRSISVGKTM